MNRRNAYLRVLIMAFVSLLSAFLLIYNIYDEYFIKSPNGSCEIRIENTAKKDVNSWGTDVRIRSISINNNMIPFENLSYNENEWIFLDDLLVSINPSEPTEITFIAENPEQIKIELQKHEGSGIIAVWMDDRKLGELDLYSPTWEEISFQKKLGVVDIFSNIPMMLCMWTISYCVMKAWSSLFLLIQKSGNYKTYFVLIGGCICIGISHVMFYGLHASGKFICMEILIVTLIASINGYNSVKPSGVRNLVKNVVILTVSSIVQYYIVELVNDNIGNLLPQYLIGNISILLFIIWMLYLIIRRIHIAVGIGMIAISGFGIANYFVVQFRGSPIVPGDFFALNTAISVMDNYQFFITKEMVFSVLMLVLWIGWLCLFAREKQREPRKEFSVNAFGVLCLAISIMTLDFYRPALDLWQLSNNVKKYGVSMALVSGIRQMKRDEPSDYSRNNLEALVDDYVNVETQEREPNIIVVMNEAFSDLSVLDDRIDNDDYMSYFNSIENAIKGTALVSTIGGGTANTEYEFLTSNTMGFLPNSVPYQQYIHQDTYSFANTLKNLGYHTIALHPYDKMGYSRYRVYPHLGFEEFIDESDFENPELARDIYITDEESYEKIIELFEDNQDLNKPLFIFNVTMQNHGGYETGFYKDDVISIPGYEGRYKDVEEYLTLVKQSDEALDVLIDYFSKCEEPTIVAVFGDHQPLIKAPYYEDATGLESSQWSLEDIQQRYMVPFAIWANYDIPDKNDLQISINYLAGMISEVAGIPTTPYQEFLLDMQQEIPAMNVIGYQTKDNNWHFHSDENDNAYLKTYWNLQYNYMFDNKKIEEWFVVE